MSMSDCSKCWETPCVCGYAYRNYTPETNRKLAATILNIDKIDLYVALQDKKLIK